MPNLSWIFFKTFFQDIPCATCNDISDIDLVDSIDEMELVHAELIEADYFKTYLTTQIVMMKIQTF